MNVISIHRAKVFKWLKMKWSLWKFAKPTIVNSLLSLICYMIGWHLSTKISAMPLARSGAFATAISIAFTLYDYRRALQVSEQAASKMFQKFTQNLPLTGAASQRQIDEKLRRSTSCADSVISVVQAAILILATLVWGFGDLASRWIGGQ